MAAFHREHNIDCLQSGSKPKAMLPDQPPCCRLVLTCYEKIDGKPVLCSV